MHRARGSSSRGTQSPCHSAPVALHPFLGNQGGWNCTASYRDICSSDRGTDRLLLTHPLVIFTARALRGEQKKPWTLETGLCMATKNMAADKKQNCNKRNQGQHLEMTSSPQRR